MKKYIFILVISLHSFQHLYTQSGILNQTVAIDKIEGTTGDILDEISTKGNFFFSYGQEIDNTKYVRLGSAKQSVREFLEEILGNEFTCIEFKNKLIVSQKSKIPEFYTVEGKVTDSQTKQSVPGVTVFIPGTKPVIGAITNPEGYFRLVVPAGFSYIRLTCIGYESYDLSIGTKEKKDIELTPDNTEINEVRIVYYEKPKEEVKTGAMTSISMEKLKAKSVSVESVLQGNVSGVHVVSNSGMPGASLQVKIRGVNSLINSEPVYYLDGIPIQKSTLYTISPDDIESVNIYKDGASLSKYGARGGNGVVLLNSRLADTPGTSISFDMYFGQQQVWKKLDLMSYEEYREYFRSVRYDRFLSFDTLNPIDRADLIFRNASLANYHFSVNTGNEKSNFYISSGYYKQEAVISKLEMERYSFKLRSNHTVHPKVTIGQDISIAFLRMKGLKEGVFMNDYNNPIIGALTLLPFESADTSQSLPRSLLDFANQQNEVELSKNQRRNYAFNIDISAKVNLLPGLFYATRADLRLNYYDNITYSHTKINQQNFDDYSVYENKYLVGDLTYYWQHSVSYERSISKHHKVAASFDIEFGLNKNQWIPQQQNTYDKSLNIMIDTSGTGNSDFLKKRSQIDFSHRAFVGFIQYSYKKRVFLNLLVREDEVSIYNPVLEEQKKHSGIYPSVSVGWIFAKSKLMNSSPLSYGKIRYSWGKTGNSPQLNYTFYATTMRNMEYLYALYPERIVSRSAMVRQSNESFYWEDIYSHNAGIDLGFFQNKLFLIIDYFDNKTYLGQKTTVDKPKELVNVLNLMHQFGIAKLPLSRLRNRGFDLEMSYRNSTKNLNWQISANLSHFKNTIIEVEQVPKPLGIDEISSNLPGNPAFSFIGYKIERLFTAADYDENGMVVNQPFIIQNGKRKYAQPVAKAGDYKFKDINNDSIIDENDKTIIGNPLPKLTFGFNFYIEYKRIDLTLFWQGSWGNQIFNATKLWFYNPYSLSNWSRDIKNSYLEPIIDADTGEIIEEGNTNTDLHRFDYANANDNLRVSDFYIEDGSYLRLKNIQLGYTINPDFTKKAFIQKLRVFISAQNLFTFTNYSGLDPEVGGWGIDSGIYPQLRTYMVGLNLQF